MTVKDSYPLPRMDECIDTLGDARIFTTLDAFNCYWQIDVPTEDRRKTSFVCHGGQFQYTRMPVTGDADLQKTTVSVLQLKTPKCEGLPLTCHTNC